MLGRLIDHNTDNHHSNDRINKNLQYLDKYGNRTIFSYGITLVLIVFSKVLKISMAATTIQISINRRNT